MPTHRSFSQINQLRTCGEQYRLERVEKVPSRPSAPAVAGKIVHTATESVDHRLHAQPELGREELILIGQQAVAECYESQISEDEKVFPRDQWKTYGRRTKEKPRAEDIDWFLAVGIPRCIDAYVDWRLGNNWRLAEIPGFGPAIEVPFNYFLEGQLVHGFIDRVFLSERELPFPADLKSGQKPKTDEQLGLYDAALRKGLGWDTSGWGFFVHGLKTGTAIQTPPINIRHWSDEKLQKVYGPATKLIDLGIYIPHPGADCFHCGVSDRCDFVQSIV